MASQTHRKRRRAWRDKLRARWRAVKFWRRIVRESIRWNLPAVTAGLLTAGALAELRANARTPRPV